ncbi:MAG: biotin/lipoyl-binding protein [Oscillospiraceae bacterium]|nr:biotin/lipoyl-binding protein [Oscillospiraceae bacterium]
MKNYKVTVNGNTYEVDVEEVGGVAEVKSVQAAAPVQKATLAPKPAPVSKPAPAPAKKADAPAGAAENVLAPLPGVVLSVNVKVGDKIKANQVLLIFEAMKMENEIVADRAGTIKEIFVTKGDMLDSGTPVVSIA